MDDYVSGPACTGLTLQGLECLLDRSTGGRRGRTAADGPLSVVLGVRVVVGGSLHLRFNGRGYLRFERRGWVSALDGRLTRARLRTRGPASLELKLRSGCG